MAAVGEWVPPLDPFSGLCDVPLQQDDKIHAVFDVFDENGDGMISMDEMFKFLSSVFKVPAYIWGGAALSVTDARPVCHPVVCPTPQNPATKRYRKTSHKHRGHSRRLFYSLEKQRSLLHSRVPRYSTAQNQSCSQHICNHNLHVPIQLLKSMNLGWGRARQINLGAW